MEQWGPTIVSLVAAVLMGVFGYLYVQGQTAKDKQIDAALSNNAEIAKAIHELSTAVGLLKQSIEHITAGGEERHTQILADLNRHEDRFEKIENKIHSLNNIVNILKIKSDLKIEK